MSETVRIHTVIHFNRASIEALKTTLQSLLEQPDRDQGEIERLRARIAEQETLLAKGQTSSL